jgi:hypothetical protein
MRNDKLKDREYSQKRSLLLINAGKCVRCEGRPAASGFQCCEPCRAKVRQVTKRRSRERRELVLRHYGGKCECCGEAEMAFLTIDHADGNGGQHRAEIKRADITAWLIQHEFPLGFRVLCWNCNCGRQVNGGACPHQLKLRP